MFMSILGPTTGFGVCRNEEVLEVVETRLSDLKSDMEGPIPS